MRDKHLAFNLVSLWFFVLELCEDPRWSETSFELAVFEKFIKQLTFSDENIIVRKMHSASGFFLTSGSHVDCFFDVTDSLPLTLAAKIIHIFLLDILSQRRINIGLNPYNERQQLLEQFLSLEMSDSSKYKDYPLIFDEIMKLCSQPSWSLPELEGIVVRNLFPFAPYLMKLFVLKSNIDLQYCADHGIADEDNTIELFEDFED